MKDKHIVNEPKGWFVVINRQILNRLRRRLGKKAKVIKAWKLM